MRIGKIIGNVTLNQVHPTFQGARLRLVVPVTLAELASGSEPQGESLVLWDDLNAGNGATVCFSEGGEAAQPFRPEPKPVDAYLAAILDDIHLDPSSVQQILRPPST
jgi:ethanolamine utilization protein EutN